MQKCHSALLSTLLFYSVPFQLSGSDHTKSDGSGWDHLCVQQPKLTKQGYLNFLPCFPTSYFIEGGLSKVRKNFHKDNITGSLWTTLMQYRKDPSSWIWKILFFKNCWYNERGFILGRMILRKLWRGSNE